MCTELQPHFSKEDFLQPRRKWNGPRASTASQHPMVSKQAFIVRCFILLPFPNFWANGATHVESAVRYIKASDKKGKKQTNQMTDSWIRAHRLHARHRAQKCASFSCISPYAQEHKATIEHKKEKKKMQEKVEYIDTKTKKNPHKDFFIIPYRQSSSFFQGTEIHLDLHKTGEATAMTQAGGKSCYCLLQSWLHEIWERSAY